LVTIHSVLFCPQQLQLA